MYWILATIAVLLIFAVPRLRPLGIVGCIVLGVMLAWGMLQRWNAPQPDAPPPPTRGRPATPGTTLTAVPLSKIRVEQLRLTGAGAPFELRGRIANDATELRLQSLTLQIVRRDCYEGALDPSGCVTIWQHQHWIELSVPPQQARDFAATIWAHSPVARVRGTVEDSFRVLAASGAPVRPQ